MFHTTKIIIPCLFSKSQDRLRLLERTLKGEEPNDFLDEIFALNFQNGENPESLIKVYKWIWGQEDVNYPNGEGRKMSWTAIEELRKKLQ